jgi:hypothetical protein
MSNQVSTKQITCLVCGTQYTCEAPFAKTFAKSTHSVKGTVIAKGVLNSTAGRVVDVTVQAECPILSCYKTRNDISLL